MVFGHKFFSFGKRCLGAFGRAAFVIPTTMQYGYYKPPNRHTADQVPWQNMHITHTVDVKGATSVQIVEEVGDTKQRFATLQVTGRAVNPQNVPLFVIFHGKPTEGDPSIPVSGKLKKELPLYDKRVRVLWDGKAYLNEPQANAWYDTYNEITNNGKDRMLQMDGYKVLTTTKWRNRYKRVLNGFLFGFCTKQVGPRLLHSLYKEV